MSVQALTHAQKVTRLYRNLLKNMLSWTIYRRVWREEALELRAQFDANKHVDMGTALRLLKEGEEMYERHKHPDPYVCEWFLYVVNLNTLKLLISKFAVWICESRI